MVALVPGGTWLLSTYHRHHPPFSHFHLTSSHPPQTRHSLTTVVSLRSLKQPRWFCSRFCCVSLLRFAETPQRLHLNLFHGSICITNTVGEHALAPLLRCCNNTHALLRHPTRLPSTTLRQKQTALSSSSPLHRLAPVACYCCQSLLHARLSTFHRHLQGHRPTRCCPASPLTPIPGNLRTKGRLTSSGIRGQHIQYAHTKTHNTHLGTWPCGPSGAKALVHAPVAELHFPIAT